MPVEHQGKRFICLRDPLGFNTAPVFMPLATLDLIRLFDGAHAVVDLQAEWMRQKGDFLFSDDIRKLIQQLDEHLLLDSPRFHAMKQQIEQEYINDPIRKAAHAGESYAADPESLRRQLEGFFTAGGGAGKPQRREPSNHLKGIIAPHIDLRVGGICYTSAYKTLAEESAAETLIILGTSHYGLGDLFVLTRKDFQTPLGVLKTDQLFIDMLEENFGGRVSSNDMIHRMEHSIEFQVVFLQSVFHGPHSIRIVPILCTSFHDMILKNSSPMHNPHVSRFVRALRETIRQYEHTTCFVVGADLSHIGRKFGDPFAAQGMLQRIEREDLDMLQTVESIDAEGFFRSVSRDRDQRKICGLPPIYTFLASVEATLGKLLKYEQWSEEATQSAVTYASMAFYEVPPPSPTPISVEN